MRKLRGYRGPSHLHERLAALTFCVPTTASGMAAAVEVAGNLEAYYCHHGRWALPDPADHDACPRPRSDRPFRTALVDDLSVDGHCLSAPPISEVSEYGEAFGW